MYKENDILTNEAGEQIVLKNNQWVPVPDYTKTFAADGKKDLSNLYGFKRPIGLHARSTLEGVGGMVDFLGTPLRLGMQAAGMDDPSGGGKRLADSLNFPTPETPVERITSGTNEVIAGGAGLMGLANKASQAWKLGSTAQGAAKAMAARPDIQFASMLGAGGAGGTAKEMGAGPLGQLGASLAGGIATPLAYSAVKSAFVPIKNAIVNAANPKKIDLKIDTMINSTLKEKGINPKDVTDFVKLKMKEDMKAAFTQSDDNLSPEAVSRLIDYRITGATPTAAGVTLDPGIITKQRNLQALGASSKDPKMQSLSQTANKNAKKLTENLNSLGADMTDDAYTVSQKVIGALDDVATGEKAKIGNLYTKARGTTGRSAEMNPSHFTQKASNLLDDAMVGGKLPADVRNTLNKIASGEHPLTVDIAEQLKTKLGQLGRASSDGQERIALGLVRQALDDTPLMGNQGKAAQEAFNAARNANYKWMSETVDKTPALKAVMDGIEPDKFMSNYILGSNKNSTFNSVKALRKAIGGNAEALEAVKGHIAQYLKGKLTGNAVSDDIAKLNASTYNKAFNAIGERKLSQFFDATEIAKLKAIGNVASYETAMPVGSAVNTSNTAAASTASVLDSLGDSGLLRKIPFAAQLLGNPAKSISQNITATQMSKIPQSLTQGNIQGNMKGLMALPITAGMLPINKGQDNRR